MRPFTISWLSQMVASGLLASVVMVVLNAPCALADAPIRYDNARAAMARKDWEAANYEWRHILDLSPGNQEATIGLAESLFNTGFHREAISLLEGLPLSQRPLLADLALGRTYAVTQDYAKSKDAYIRVLVKRPFQANAFNELRDLYPRLNAADQKSVKTDLNAIAKAAKRKSDDALKSGQYTDAAAYYEIASSYYHTVGLFNDYGLVLLLAGQYQKAHDQFVLLKKRGKLDFSEVNSNAAIASLSIGNFAEAKSEMMEAIQSTAHNKRKAQLYNNLGYILEMTQKRQEAKFAYQHAMALDPHLLTAQLNLAFVQQADQDYEEAIVLYQQILAKYPENAEVWNRLGFAHELRFKSKPALNAYERAIAANLQYRDSYINLALLYKKMGKMKQADATLQQLAEMGFAEMEAKLPNGSTPTASPKNPLKYVVLFPANPKVIAHIQ